MSKARSSSEHDSIDALAAGFPAGTVSGAPKVRAMEIIDELEKEKRGLYAGAVGYFSAAGEMDTAIVLRTALVKDGVMYVQAGAGIVADSDPKSEQTECVNKAKALFRAAEEAKRFASAAKRGQYIGRRPLRSSPLKAGTQESKRLDARFRGHERRREPTHLGKC